jgi:hypothetical protein
MSEADIALKTETLPPVTAPTRPVGPDELIAARSDLSAGVTSLLQNVFSFPAMLGMALVGRVF